MDLKASLAILNTVTTVVSTVEPNKGIQLHLTDYTLYK